MKHSSQRRVVTIEEHSITVGKEDLIELVQAEDPEMFATVDERSMTPALVVNTMGQDGKPAHAILQPAKLIEIIRSTNEDIPADAEICLAVRWRREVEVTQAPPPQSYAMPIVPPGAEGYVQESAMPAGGAASCATCGGVPDIQGPTPECFDVNGCARVRNTRGEIGIARSVEPDGAPRVGAGGAGGTHKLVNRETGETVFADKNGMPYGRHDDYQR